MGFCCGPSISSISNLDGENSLTDLEIQQVKQLGISSIIIKFKDDTEKEALDKDI